MHFSTALRPLVAWIFWAGLGVLCIGSCRQGNTNSSTDAGFDREAFLREISGTHILPSYKNAHNRTVDLQAAVQAFTQTPTEQSLRAAQGAWLDAYRAWVPASLYDFGPADGSFGTLRQNIATFPVNTALTEKFITEGKFDLNNFNRDTRGLLGIEYLLFSENALQKFTGQEGAQRRKYITAITNDVKTKLEAVSGAWLATGSNGYTNTFTTNNGTSIGSSTSMLFNEFVKSYEELKNFKFGLPLGLRPGQQRPEPEKVEGYYSGKTLEFATLHLEALESLWFGRSVTISGTPTVTPAVSGFEKYLASVAGGSELIAQTKIQLAALNGALRSVPTTPAMSGLVLENHPSLTALYTELQKQTRFFKSDMSSLLGISITYASGDGD